MNDMISNTPTIDEIVQKTLIIPWIGPDLDPLELLEAVRYEIERALNTDTQGSELSELSEHLKSYSQTRLKAALRYVDSRIHAAKALDEYLWVLYQDSVGKDSEMTPHSEIKSTPRFHLKEVLDHLRTDLLQGTEDDIRSPDQVTKAHQNVNNANGAPKTSKPSSLTPTEKAFKSSDVTSFLIADLLAKGPKFRKKEEAGALNIASISMAVQEHALSKFPTLKGQSDSSIRDRLKNGMKALEE